MSEENFLGLVVRSTGKWYDVRLDDERHIDCRIMGRFRLNGKPITNPVAVGDRVRVTFEDKSETALIKEIFPRRNYVARQSPRKLHQLHLLASNVDQSVLIVTLKDPMLKPAFIDRFLLMSEPQNIPAVIVFNKCDLHGKKDEELYEFMHAVYTDIGYTVLKTSALNNVNIEALRDILKGKCSLIGGQSGVGKSSLVNAIDPTFDIKTNYLSSKSGKGQHTTTFAQMHHLDFGAQIIDTPGIKSLSFNNLEPADVAHNFRDIFHYSDGCKYNNCLHREEPKCNVRLALDEGKISELRYYNYINILEEIEDQNHWERKTDF